MSAEKIFDQLLEVSLLFQADISRSMSALGLTVMKTHLLWEVHQHGPRPQQRLAEALGVSARHVTALVDALESDDYARRRPHPHDRRAVLVELTDKGMVTMAEMQKQRSRDAAALVSDLDVRAVKRVEQSLHAILKRLRQLAADTDGTDGGSAG